MKWSVKFAAWTLTILAILLISLSAFLKIYLSPERIRIVIEEQLSASLGRKVSVGMVDVDMIKGLEIRDVRIGEDRRLGDLDFVRIRGVSIGYDFKELFQKRILLDSVRIEGPEIYIRHIDGKPAYSGFIEMPEKKEEVRKQAPFVLLLNAGEIRDGSVYYYKGEARTELRGIDINIRGDLYPFNGIDAELLLKGRDNLRVDLKKLSVASGVGSSLRIKTDGKERLKMDGSLFLDRVKAHVDGKEISPFDAVLDAALEMDLKGGAEIRRLSVRLGKGSSLNLSGGIRDMKGLKGFDITGAVEFDLGELAEITAGYQVFPRKGRIRADGLRVTGEMPDLRVHSKITMKDTEFVYKEVPLVVNGFVAGEAGGGGELNISGFELSADNAITLKGKFYGRGWGRESLSLQAEAELDNERITRILPGELSKKMQEMKLSGSSYISATVSKDSPEGPIKVQAAGRIELPEFKTGGTRVSGARGRVSLTSADLIDGMMKADLDLSADEMQVEQVDSKFSVEGISVSASVETSTLFRDDISLKADMGGGPIQLQRGDLFIEGDSVKIALPSVSVGNLEKKVSLDAAAGVGGFRFKRGKTLFSEPQMSLSASITGDYGRGNLEIGSLGLTIPGLAEVQADGRILKMGEHVELKLKADGIDHKGLTDRLRSGFMKGIKVGGRSKLSVTVSGSLPGKGEAPVNIVGGWKIKDTELESAAGTFAVKGMSADLGFDISPSLKRVKGEVRIDRLENKELLDTPVDVSVGFDGIGEGTNLDIRNISVSVPKKALELNISGEVKDYTASPRGYLNASVSFNSMQTVHLAKGINLSGGLSISGRIETAGPEAVSISGAARFDRVDAAYRDIASAKGINGKVGFSQGMRYSKGMEMIRERDLTSSVSSGEVPYTAALYRLLRPYIKDGYDLTAESISIKGYEMGPFSADLLWDRGMVLIDKYEIDLFDGTATGRVRAAMMNGEWGYRIYSNVAGVDFRRIFKIEEGNRRLRVSGNLDIRGEGSDFEGEVNLSDIGKDILNRGLLVMDPGESNPQIVNIRKMVNSLGWVPRDAGLWVRHGELNMDITLQRRRSTLLNLLSLEKIPVRRIPVEYLIKKGLKKAD